MFIYDILILICLKKVIDKIEKKARRGERAELENVRIESGEVYRYMGCEKCTKSVRNHRS